MFISPSERRVFLVAPKTGSTAVRRYLKPRGFYPAKVTGQIPDLRVGGNPNHWRLSAVAPAEWQVAVTVRNHWDALVSWWAYTYHNRGQQKFDERFVKRLMTDPVHRDWFWPDPHRLWGAYTDHAGTILRHETLESDLSDWLGQPVDLTRANVSAERRGRHYAEFYDADLRDFVHDWFRDEIEQYGYTFKAE